MFQPCVDSVNKIRFVRSRFKYDDTKNEVLNWGEKIGIMTFFVSVLLCRSNYDVGESLGQFIKHEFTFESMIECWLLITE